MQGGCATSPPERLIWADDARLLDGRAALGIDGYLSDEFQNRSRSATIGSQRLVGDFCGALTPWTSSLGSS
jgi:hypothetical protein